ncbi:GNAT family N-acetyltransferase [Gaoshiqia sediminis]|uniref:GNAT family N-acetyltransferase n=1 Tax=Gaoshiqia sediminis TaxID=2986998 RepID=A0AA41Y3C5_9BACT|nr:GNAT family N-acetyltransferase [Gaoshiqia sediminis]MCW0482706.1 GNAT family N-acetyltransferase [Gaoshiqia sediminis]
MELRKVLLKDMDAFVQTNWFLQLPDQPVSLLRADSYLHNPHALPDDPVLYFLQEADRIIAYRTVFPARLTNEEKRFAWLSGNWVHPDFRRQGLSDKLLREIVIDWEQRLLFTNYAPASLQLYLKTQLFHPVYAGVGRRFYLFARTRKLFQLRYPQLKWGWAGADFLIRLAASIRLLAFKNREEKDFSFQKMRWPDDDCLQLAEKQQSESLFLRGRRELQWILRFPWISTVDGQQADRYAFSSFAEQFFYQTVKVFHHGNFVGFLMYSVRDAHLKTLHGHFEMDCTAPLARFLVQAAAVNRLEMITVLNPALAEAIFRASSPFLFSKKINHQIYASFPVSAKNLKIQDGEGDFIFS